MQKIVALTPLSNKPFIHTALIFGHDSTSLRSLEANKNKLDMVFSDWFTMEPVGCAVHESIDWDILEMLEKNRIITIPRFTNTDA